MERGVCAVGAVLCRLANERTGGEQGREACAMCDKVGRVEIGQFKYL